MDRKRQRDGEGEGEAPAGVDAGAEIALSVEETNKLRISLGLKPLNSQGAKAADESAAQRHQDVLRQKEQEVRAEQFKTKQREKKRQAAQDDFLAVKGLGEADEDEADMQNWVERTRVAEVARLAEERADKRAAEAAAARKQAAQGAGEGSDGEGGTAAARSAYTAADLAGMKVKHSADDLGEGEVMVLTLADRPLLDERGQGLRADADEDELENVLKAQDMQRDKARAAAGLKAKPLWEEDGKKRTLLEKYDEEEASVVLELGQGGQLPSLGQQQQEEVRRKLQEGGKMLDSAAVGSSGAGLGAPGSAGSAAMDYQTEAEAAAAAAAQQGFKKMRKKKVRQLRAKSAEPEPEDTAALVEQLEAAAEVQGAAVGAGPGAAGDLGSRTNRLTARERTEQALRTEAEARRAKFDAAVAKGNWASQALRPGAAPLTAVGEDDEGDRELQASLARARRLTQQQQTQAGGGAASAGTGRQASTMDSIAAAAAKAREEEEQQLKVVLAQGKSKGSMVVNDTMEFVRNIHVKPDMIASQSVGLASVAGSNSRLPPPPPPPAAAAAAPAAAGPSGKGASGAGVPSQQGEGDDGYMGLGPGTGDLQGGGTEAAHGWVSTAPMDIDDDDTGPGRGRRYRQKHGAGEGAGPSGEGAAEAPQQSVIGERSLGRGLASALSALKDKGSLMADSHITWAGRTNDRSKNALQGLVGDVYTGGQSEDRMALAIEAALTTKDEFGRVMTPKERFRQLCYDFHGKRPSKNKEETRLQKAAEEIARRKNATSEVAEQGEVEGLKKVTEKVAQPYVVLQGKGAMESLQTMTGMSAAKGAMMPPPPRKSSKKTNAIPALGNLTPLLGDRKVEAMLRIKKPQQH